MCLTDSRQIHFCYIIANHPSIWVIFRYTAMSDCANLLIIVIQRCRFTARTIICMCPLAIGAGAKLAVREKQCLKWESKRLVCWNFFQQSIQLNYKCNYKCNCFSWTPRNKWSVVFVRSREVYLIKQL